MEEKLILGFSHAHTEVLFRPKDAVGSCSPPGVLLLHIGVLHPNLLQVTSSVKSFPHQTSPSSTGDRNLDFAIGGAAVGTAGGLFLGEYPVYF